MAEGYPLELCRSKKIQTVKKRNGVVTSFDGAKILAAIRKAGEATGEFDASEAFLLTLQVIRVVDNRFGGGTLYIYQIQDIVEQALISSNYLKTARAYIVYREK